jgi:hypothetical protein
MKAARLACLVTLTALPALAFAAQNPAAKPGPCDRACLEGFVDKYMDAMEKNEVSDALFSRYVKFTENGVQLPLGGEGLWYGMNGKGNYRFYVPDVETGQVAFIGTVKEQGRAAGSSTLVGLVLRLKIVNNKITEVEQLAVRPDNTAQVTGGGGGAGAGNAPRPAGAAPAPAGAPAGAAPAAPAATGGSRFPPAAEAIDRMGKPHAVYFEVIPEARRPTREELIKTANYYFTGLQRNDGKGYYPFTEDCLRFENGMITTQQQNGVPVPGACKRQFETGLRNIVSRVRDRRFVAVDRERGIVFAFAFFDHHNINWTWQLGELFKIENGEIRRIEALFHRAPFGINSGWSTFEQGMSEEAQDIR